MKVFVCLPSLNEAGTIGAVTRIVDKGLQSVQGLTSALIVNVDSNSADSTREVFGKESTFYPKTSFVPEGEPGKGRNLLAFSEQALAEGADYCITVDTDITSASEDWMLRLLEPLLSGEADYVTPLYERSRFEGSSTNHFAYPVVYGFTGQRVRQPIAGDFAFNRAFLATIGNTTPIEAVYGYGIDIFLSLIAATSGLRIKQVELGKKIHGPSFNKLEAMFPQIAAAALTVIRQAPLVGAISQPYTGTANILEANMFPHRQAAAEMIERAKKELSRLLSQAHSWLGEPARFQVLNLAQSQENLTLEESQQRWVDVLTAWCKFGLAHPGIAATQMGQELLPFFVLRAVQFWFLSESLTATETERQVNEQAEKIRTRLQSQLLPAA